MRFTMPEAADARSLHDAFIKDMPRGELLVFHGAEGMDVYNPSVPFELSGRSVIAGRVQERTGALSVTRLFGLQTDGSYIPIPGAPEFTGMEDPFVAEIGRDIILGGTRALWDENGELITYFAEFYKLNGLDAPELLFRGPDRMKDIRLLDMKDGRVCVFTRPQGDAMAAYGRIAAIGVFFADGLSGITAEKIADAPLLKWHFRPEEWGGVNQPLLLPDGRIGVIGHIARGEHVNGEHVLHYYSMAQTMDPVSGTVSPMKLIGCRECYPAAQAREKRLSDVCFTAGIVREGEKTILYSGLSDACCGRMEIRDPFR